LFLYDFAPEELVALFLVFEKRKAKNKAKRRGAKWDPAF
jgi:hypothetical protein